MSPVAGRATEDSSGKANARTMRVKVRLVQSRRLQPATHNQRQRARQTVSNGDEQSSQQEDVNESASQQTQEEMSQQYQKRRGGLSA